jgi:PAS domain S-box-containing protein
LEYKVKKLEQEIVECKQAEEALRESEKRYSTLSEASFEGIVIHEEGKIIDANNRLAEMYGYKLDELIGTDALRLIPPEHRGTVRNKIASEDEGPYEVLGLRKDSSTFHTEIRVRHMIYHGRKVRVAIARDITQQKKLESQLQEGIKMEAIGTLAGGIAHQFNNALSAIIGNIEMLMWDLSDDENIRRYVEPMKDSSQRMTNLTSQLLAYARGGKYQEKIISLNTFIKDTLPLIEHTIAPAVYVDTYLPMNVMPVKADLTQTLVCSLPGTGTHYPETVRTI